MSESRSVLAGPLGFVGFSIILGTGVLGYHLGWKEASPEVFGVLLEVSVGGALVAAILNRSEAASARKEACEALIRRIDALAANARTAKLLLNAHKSAKTWTERMRTLLGYDEEIQSIVEGIHALFPNGKNAELRGTPRATVVQLKDARGTVLQLIAEYRDKHSRVGWEQEQYEEDKRKLAKDWEARQTLHDQHWQKLQQLLPESARFATRGDMINSGEITTQEGRLLQAAAILWNQFKPAPRGP